MPLRLELGPRDLAAGQVTVAHRLSGGKEQVPLAGIAETVMALLAREQRTCSKARERPATPASRMSPPWRMRSGHAAGLGPPTLAGGRRGRRGRTGPSAITVRCLTRADGSVPDSDTEPDLVAYVARSY